MNIKTAYSLGVTMHNTQKDQIKKLLQLKTAPKGDIAADIKVALYVVACLYQFNFNNVNKLGMCAQLLGAVGFKGHITDYGIGEYKQILNELVASGSLVSLGNFDVYAAPEQIVSLKAEVRAKEIDEAFGKNKIYTFFIRTDKGDELNLFSNIQILPHDEVEVFSIKGSDKAYVNRLIKKRLCVLGRLQSIGTKERYARLMPDEPNLQGLEFSFINKADLNGAKSGDIVIAEIVKRTGRGFIVKVQQVVHDIGNLNNVIVMAVLRNDIPNTWPENLSRVLPRIPSEVKKEETIGRVDLRDLPLVTIDGEDARDFDDAVYCKAEGKKWRLFVSIADVSYYVRPGTLIDKEAVFRCNSCYFPNYVIPMLPEKLSNGICSLNPNVDRLCMTCEMIINAKGQIETYRFYPAVMRSHARLTYTEAWKMISEGISDIPEHQSLISDVKELYKLYGALKADRKRRGGISIESEELHFIFNEKMEIVGVQPLVRNDAHMLIEECMIAANVAAATFVSEHNYETLYRIHAKPPIKKLGLLAGQLARFGLSLTGGEEPTSQDFAKLAQAIENREDKKVISEFILRSMAKAEYSPQNIGHFGLALQKYAHFTSPIRRYADLQLHRVIKFILEKEEHAWGKIGARYYNKPELLALGSKCTERELAADTAEREVDAQLACVYAQQFIGEIVEGTITGCSSFGLFVHLDNIGADGMVYIGNFSSYMNYNAVNQTLVDSYNKVYAIGDKIKVIVGAVDVNERKIDLLPLSNRPNKSQLRKGRDKQLAQQERLRQLDENVNKEDLFDKIAHISRAQEAQAQDEAPRKIHASDDWGDELLMSKHYANPLKMPDSAFENIGVLNGSSSKAKKKKRKN